MAILEGTPEFYYRRSLGYEKRIKELEDKYKQALKALAILKDLSGYHDGFDCMCTNNKCDTCVAVKAMDEALDAVK